LADHSFFLARASTGKYGKNNRRGWNRATKKCRGNGQNCSRMKEGKERKEGMDFKKGNGLAKR
jgi:hypothetical protein